MPENTKINISALLKKSTSGHAPISTEETKDMQQEKDHVEIKPKMPIEDISIKNQEQGIPLVKSESIEEVQTNKHSLSLDVLKTRGRTEEEITEDKKQEIERLEIQQNLAKMQAEETKNQSSDQHANDEELFGNYESKFEGQSTQILKRMRMPKTRIGMLLGFTVISMSIIGTLMLVDPQNHSMGNYKTSIGSIYDDIKNGKNAEDTENLRKATEDIARRDGVTQTEEIVEETDIEPQTQEKKEEIKKENLKNFLLENYK